MARKGATVVRPLDTGLVMRGLDDGGDQARDADAVGAAVDRPLDAVGPGDHRLHRHGVLGAEVEDLADLDAARLHALVGRNFALEPVGVMDVLGRRVELRPRRG